MSTGLPRQPSGSRKLPSDGVATGTKQTSGDDDTLGYFSHAGDLASDVLAFPKSPALLWPLEKPGGGLRSEQGQEHD